MSQSPHFFSTYAYLEARNPSARIAIGDNTWINNGVVIVAESSEIEIGRDCLIGTNVEIINSDFHVLALDGRRSGKQGESIPVRIGNDVFIGSNVKVLKGVSIGNGSVIANGSVVTNNIPEFVIAGGIPAKVIKEVQP